LIRLKRLFFGVLVMICIGLGLPTTVFGGTSVIYSFAGDEDGEYADTDLAIDKAGNLYGTTVLGGDFGGGTVFQLSPSGNGWVHTVLYSFTGGPDGGEPYKGVTLDAQGNLYGTVVPVRRVRCFCVVAFFTERRRMAAFMVKARSSS